MTFEIDLGDLGIVDADIEAVHNIVRGAVEVELKKVEITLPIEFEVRRYVRLNVLSLLSQSVADDIRDALALTILN